MPYSRKFASRRKSSRRLRRGKVGIRRKYRRGIRRNIRRGIRRRRYIGRKRSRRHKLTPVCGEQKIKEMKAYTTAQIVASVADNSVTQGPLTKVWNAISLAGIGVIQNLWKNRVVNSNGLINGDTSLVYNINSNLWRCRMSEKKMLKFINRGSQTVHVTVYEMYPRKDIPSDFFNWGGKTAYGPDSIISYLNIANSDYSNNENKVNGINWNGGVPLPYTNENVTATGKQLTVSQLPFWTPFQSPSLTHWFKIAKVRKTILEVGHSALYSTKTKPMFFSDKDLGTDTTATGTWRPLTTNRLFNIAAFKGKTKILLVSYLGDMVHNDGSGQPGLFANGMVTTGDKISVDCVETTELKFKHYITDQPATAYNYIVSNSAAAVSAVTQDVDYDLLQNSNMVSSSLSSYSKLSDNATAVDYKTPVTHLFGEPSTLGTTDVGATT